MSLQKRPWWLILLTAAFAVFQAVALLHDLSLPPALVAQISLPLPLNADFSALWALIFAYLAVNLVRGTGFRRTRWIFAAFVLYSGLRLVLFAQADYDQARRPVIIIATLLTLALLVLWRRHR